MKVKVSEYLKKQDVAVLVAEAIFSELYNSSPTKTISEISDTSSGGTPLRGNHDYYNGDIPWLKSGELNDSIIEKAEEYITEKGLRNSSAKLNPAGTLLVAMYGATVGKTGITKIEAATNQAVCAVFPHDIISRDYLFWFFKQHRYKFIEQSKGGAQPNISQTVINATSVPVPDKQLQDTIVSLLTCIHIENKLDFALIPDRFKARVNKIFNTKSSLTSIDTEVSLQLALLKQLRQQILQDAVQGKLVPQDPNDEPASVLLEKIKAEKAQLVREKKIRPDKPLPAIKPEEVPFGIPESWVWCRFGEMALYSDAGKSFKCEEVPIIFNEWGVIKVSAVSWNEFLEEKNKRYAKNAPDDISAQIQIGDFIISRANTTELVGKSVVVKNISKNLLLSDKTIRFKFADAIFADFTNLCNNSNHARAYYALRGTGSSPSMKNITRDDMKCLLMPLPPSMEQLRIVTKVDHLMTLCEELEQSIRQNQEYTQKLLQVALKEALEPAT